MCGGARGHHTACQYRNPGANYCDRNSWTVLQVPDKVFGAQNQKLMNAFHTKDTPGICKKDNEICGAHSTNLYLLDNTNLTISADKFCLPF